MAKTIGIDLGTTNSAVAVMEGGKPKIIYSQEGRNVIPSVVDPTKRTVGDVAKRQLVLNPQRTIYKSLMSYKTLIIIKNSKVIFLYAFGKRMIIIFASNKTCKS